MLGIPDSEAVPEIDQRGLGHRGGVALHSFIWGPVWGSLGWWVRGWWGEEGVETIVKEEVGE